MKKIILYGNEKDRSVLDGLKYPYDFIFNNTSYIIYKVSNINDFKKINIIKKNLAIKIILVVKGQKSNITFDDKETEFLISILKYDLAKQAAFDLNISRQGFYLRAKKMLQKTNLESIEALRYWAILHLSV